MAIYRQKPVEVQAVQFTGTNVHELAELFVCEIDEDFEKVVYGKFILEGPQGDSHVYKDDYVVRGPTGTLSVYSEKDFEACFEEVD